MYTITKLILSFGRRQALLSYVADMIYDLSRYVLSDVYLYDDGVPTMTNDIFYREVGYPDMHIYFVVAKTSNMRENE